MSAFTRQVVSFDAHSDRGRDTDGSDILVSMAGADPAPPAGCTAFGSGVEKIRLSDSAKTCLLQLHTWTAAAHISINGPHGYVLVDQVHTPLPYGTGTADMPEEANWQTDWQLSFNEIDLVSLDGTHVWRLAHHRSRRPPSGTCTPYWYQPRSAISPDGKYVVFDANFNTQPVCDFEDVFLMQIK